MHYNKNLEFNYPDSSFQLVKVEDNWRTIKHSKIDSAKTVQYLRQLSTLSASKLSASLFALFHNCSAACILYSIVASSCFSLLSVSPASSCFLSRRNLRLSSSSCSLMSFGLSWTDPLCRENDPITISALTVSHLPFSFRPVLVDRAIVKGSVSQRPGISGGFRRNYETAALRPQGSGETRPVGRRRPNPELVRQDQRH